MLDSLYNSFINKTDYVVLEALAIRECNTPFCSVTLSQLIDFCNMSNTKVRNAIKIFSLMKCIEKGNKDSRKDTYYITPLGEEHFLDVFGYTEDDLYALRREYEAKHSSNSLEECSVSEDLEVKE